MQPLLFHSLLSPVTAQPQSKLTCSNYKSTTTKITFNVSGSLGLIFEAWPSTLLGPRPPRTESEHIDRSWEEVPAGRGLSRLQSQLSARSRDPVSTLRQLPPWYRGEQQTQVAWWQDSAVSCGRGGLLPYNGSLRLDAWPNQVIIFHWIPAIFSVNLQILDAMTVIQSHKWLLLFPTSIFFLNPVSANELEVPQEFARYHPQVCQTWFHFCIPRSSHTNNWAVLVDTSRFWFNYRHVANVLSVYRSVKRLGIPDSQVDLLLLLQQIVLHNLLTWIDLFHPFKIKSS